MLEKWQLPIHHQYQNEWKVMVDDVWGDYCAISCLGSALALVRVIPVPFLKDIRVVRNLLFY
jgi:hypothetical protein